MYRPASAAFETKPSSSTFPSSASSSASSAPSIIKGAPKATEINTFVTSGLTKSGPYHREGLLNLLKPFVTANNDPRSSDNFNSPHQDDMNPLAKALQHADFKDNNECVVHILSALKILARKEINRSKISPAVLDAIIPFLSKPKSSAVACESANFMLNICYDKSNVEPVLQSGALNALVSLLTSPAADASTLAAAAGAIQSICVTTRGKSLFRLMDGVEPLIKHLSSKDTRVVSRAMGAIHNLSSDPLAIPIVRSCGGIPDIVAGLRSHLAAITAASAGCIQNLSRESMSRDLIRELEAVPALADLLASSDIHTQTCAAGALLNILAPELEQSGGEKGDASSVAQMQGFKKLLSLSLVMGVINNWMFPEGESSSSSAAILDIIDDLDQLAASGKPKS